MALGTIIDIDENDKILFAAKEVVARQYGNIFQPGVEISLKDSTIEEVWDAYFVDGCIIVDKNKKILATFAPLKGMIKFF